jgi:hypothetical protein
MTSVLSKTAMAGIVAAALFAAAPAFAGCSPDDLKGSASSARPDRVVNVPAKTRGIAVNYGETVRFVVQSGSAKQEVTWRFDGVANKVTLADLDAKIPNGKNVAIYVNQAMNPLNQSGGEGE